jgi:hypothetical protein
MVDVMYDWAVEAISVVGDEFPGGTYEGLPMLRELAVLFEQLIVIRINGRANPR